LGPLCIVQSTDKPLETPIDPTDVIILIALVEECRGDAVGLSSRGKGVFVARVRVCLMDKAAVGW